MPLSHPDTLRSLVRNRSLLVRGGRSHNADAYDNIYYNDIETIQRKTKLAVKRGGGIMIWQITVDTTGQFSLLKSINNV